MKTLSGVLVVLAVLAMGISSAEAVIKIEVAEVQNGGVAFIQGNGAVLGAQITWDGAAVTTANTNNGGFSFFGVLPADCRGELSDTAETVLVDVLNCTPVSDGAPAPVPQTGQTTSFATGDDGDIQAGVMPPDPRFTDNGDGTVTDNLTGLIWLKNANCFGAVLWQAALNAANALADGQCGLTDGSVAGDWYLSNVKELQSLIDFGNRDPALPTGHPFSGVQSNRYWSSTAIVDGLDFAWFVFLLDGTTNFGNKGFSTIFVWPVRGGQ